MDQAKVIEYFNTTLRNHLKYPETFQFQFFSKSIVLLPSEGTERSLLHLIKTNVNLKKSLIETLQSSLGYTIELRSRGTDIIIKLEDKIYTIKDLPPDVGVYANIAKNLNEKQLKNFCSSSPQVTQVCRNEHFYIQLIRDRFPKYHRDISLLHNQSPQFFRWKEVYLGLVYIEDKINFDNLFDTNSDDNASHHLYFTSIQQYLIDNYLESLRYLILEDFIQFNQDQVRNITNQVHNLEIIKHLLTVYKIEDNGEDLMDAFLNSIGYPEMMIFFLNYRGVGEFGEEVKIEPDDINISTRYNLIYARNPEIDPESYKIWHNFVGSDYNISDLDLLLELGALNPRSPEMLQYFKEILPEVNFSDPTEEEIEEIEDIRSWLLRDFLVVNSRAYKVAWDRYKHLLTSEEIIHIRNKIININPARSGRKQHRENSEELLSFVNV